MSHEELKFKAKLKKMQEQTEQAEEELNIIASNLKDKEQESRLDELKIRELIRKIPHKAVRPIYENSRNTNAPK